MYTFMSVTGFRWGHIALDPRDAKTSASAFQVPHAVKRSGQGRGRGWGWRQARSYVQVAGKCGHHSHPWGLSPWAWVPKNLWIDNGYFLNKAKKCSKAVQIFLKTMKSREQKRGEWWSPAREAVGREVMWEGVIAIHPRRDPNSRCAMRSRDGRFFACSL